MIWAVFAGGCGALNLWAYFTMGQWIPNLAVGVACLLWAWKELHSATR